MLKAGDKLNYVGLTLNEALVQLFSSETYQGLGRMALTEQTNPQGQAIREVLGMYDAQAYDLFLDGLGARAQLTPTQRDGFLKESGGGFCVLYQALPKCSYCSVL